MNKIYRIKNATGGLAVALNQIVAIRYLNSEGADGHAVEIMASNQILDAVLSTADLEGLQRAWDEAL